MAKAKRKAEVAAKRAAGLPFINIQQAGPSWQKRDDNVGEDGHVNIEAEEKPPKKKQRREQGVWALTPELELLEEVSEGKMGTRLRPCRPCIRRGERCLRELGDLRTACMDCRQSKAVCPDATPTDYAFRKRNGIEVPSGYEHPESFRVVVKVPPADRQKGARQPGESRWTLKALLEEQHKMGVVVSGEMREQRGVMERGFELICWVLKHLVDLQEVMVREAWEECRRRREEQDCRDSKGKHRVETEDKGDNGEEMEKKEGKEGEGKDEEGGGDMGAAVSSS